MQLQTKEVEGVKMVLHCWAGVVQYDLKKNVNHNANNTSSLNKDATA
jgi:hypothetical protein